MKLIFLDVDGVLNSEQSFIMYRREYAAWKAKGKSDGKKWDLGFRAVDRPDPICMSNLKWLLEECEKRNVEVKIVISSTWRILHMRELRMHFRRHKIDWKKYVIGQTPKIHFGRNDRGYEIQWWLDDNCFPKSDSVMMPKYTIEDFIIIDDNSDMAHLAKDYFLQTDPNVGLMYPDVVYIMKRFVYDEGKPKDAPGPVSRDEPGPEE